MSVREPDPVEDLLPFPQRNDMARLDAQICYLLMCAALVIALIGVMHGWFFFFAAILWVGGGGWGVVKRREGHQTLWEDHFDNIIFVLTFSGAAVPAGAALVWYFDTWLPLGMLWLWGALRMSLAFYRLLDQRPFH
ncbi:hypothetical protein FCL40_09360 [Ferrimonas sediminicola]|uniref:Uncharacterized protein n=1 Tax=Ferrimonas sediminicola TaxID=2569538 RepID=A0A4U1BFP3_9GAMM|nr:hypothetical protein [Ferrimonas sediminicola]TKB48841.1 hypothetical protein FCL40_09360 [Ferrimonas sediminicola]